MDNDVIDAKTRESNKKLLVPFDRTEVVCHDDRLAHTFDSERFSQAVVKIKFSSVSIHIDKLYEY